MYLCCSGDSFTVSNVDETDSIVTGTVSGTSSDAIDNMLYQDQCLTQDQCLDSYLNSCIDDLLKDESFHNFSNFPTDDDLHQDDNCEEKLFPDMLKLVEPNSENVIRHNTSQLSTSGAVKRPFIDSESDPFTTISNSERIDFKQGFGGEKHCNALSAMNSSYVNVDSSLDNYALVSAGDGTPLISVRPETNNACCHKTGTFTEEIAMTSVAKNGEQSVAKNAEQSVLYSQTSKQYETENGLAIKYHRDNLFYTEFNSSIYKDAIRKMDIDSNGLFRDSVSEEIVSSYNKYKGFIKSSIDLSITYSSVRIYILNKFSSFINDIIPNIDIVITSGMSISDMKCNCISNYYFFEKLREKCEKIVGDVRATPDNCFLNILQNSIILSYESNFNIIQKRVRFASKKNKFSPKLKMLMIDTISNLPQSIAYTIKNFDKADVVRGLFLSVHGIFMARSLIRNLALFYNYSKDKIINVKNIEDDLYLFSNLLEKIGSLVRTSCIFHEGEVFLPDEFSVEKISKYLLSDMYGVTFRFRKKLKLLPNGSMPKIQRVSDDVISDDINPTKTKAFDTCSNVGLQLPELDVSEINTAPSVAVNTKVEINDQHTTGETLKKFVTLKELKIKKYNRCNLCSAEAVANIYEYAIKKIAIDSNESFKNNMLEELDNIIENNGFERSSIDLSSTYSEIRKYVLDKISPCIRDIISTTDPLITTGMSLSDIKSSCISNDLFLDKLREKCAEIVDGISVISEDVFLSMVKGYVRFGLDGYLNIVRRRKKLCSKVKSLIIETISDLPRSIVFEIGRFKLSEILDGFFWDFHGVLISKSLVRSLKYHFNFNGKRFSNKGFRDNIELFNNLFSRLGSVVRTFFIFHEGRVFLPDEPTVGLLSRYLLSDIHGFPFRLHKDLKMSTEIVLDLHCSSNDVGLKSFDFSKDIVSNATVDAELQLPKKSNLIPKINSRWDPTSITSLNIYELAISMVNVDKGEFENSFISKIKHKKLREAIDNGSKISVDLSLTYSRIRSYILEIFSPFLKEIEEETKAKIKLCHETTLDELEHAYISNEEFFSKLHNFCNESIECIKNISDSSLIDMMQCSVFLHLESESKVTQRIDMKRRIKNLFNEDMVHLLINNISSLPGKIINTIKLLPKSKLVEEHFSRFNDMYVDNKSLLKAKSVFDFTQEKIIKNKTLSILVDKISSDIVDRFGDGNSVDVSRYLYKTINKYIFHEKLNTLNYIRKLVREEIPTLINNLSDPVMIMYSDKIELADKKTKCEILCKFEFDLIRLSIRSYKSLCFKAYKSKIANRVLFY